MGLKDLVERHAGKLTIAGVLGLTLPFMYVNNRMSSYFDKFDKVTQSTPEYVDLQRSTQESNDLLSDLNQYIPLKDALNLTQCEREGYHRMQERYEFLLDEQRTLKLTPAIVRANVELGNESKKIISGLYGLFIATTVSLLPMSFGALGLQSRWKKQRDHAIKLAR